MGRVTPRAIHVERIVLTGLVTTEWVPGPM